MNRSILTPRFSFALIAGLTSLAPAGSGIAGTGASGKAPAPPPVLTPAELSPWRISAGFSFRQFDHIGMDTGSDAAQFLRPRLARAGGHGDHGAGPASGYADRQYRDGFVFIDSGTVSGGGDTWYWGYDSASQVGSSSIAWHGGTGTSSSFAESVSRTDPGAWEGDGESGGPVIQLDYLFSKAGPIELSASLQWGFWNLDGSHSGSSFAAHQSSSVHQTNATDIYDTAGIIVPGAPYRGTYGGPGPLLRNEPSQRIHSMGHRIGHDTAAFANRIEESFDVDLHALSLGPTVSLPFGRFAVSLSTGVALNIASYDADRTETLSAVRGSGRPRTLRTWRDTAEGTELLWGAYAQGAVSCALTSQLSVSAYGRADWSETLSEPVGPSTLNFDPGGWSVGALVSWRF